jgi:membrane fusion protein (multidrug efflux system)
MKLFHKTKRGIVILLAILILLSVKFFFLNPKPSKGATPKPGNANKTAVPVTAFVIGKQGVKNTLQASGTILPFEHAELKTEASGRVIFLNIPEGKRVQKGTLLLKLNDDDLKAQLMKITTQLKLANELENRQRSLFRIGGISQQEYDIALTNRNLLQSDSAYQQAQIAKTEIRAPFDGIVGIRTVSVGSYAVPNTLITQIQQTSQVKIDFFLPEKYGSLLNEGDTIRYTIEGVAGTFKGTITVKDPAIDVTNRSIRYRAIGDNPKGLLLPGAFARVEVPFNEGGETVFIPTEAIVPVLNGKKVYIIKNNTAEEHFIETGFRTDQYIQVLSGIQTGDSVVVSGNVQVKNGSRVRISKEKNKRI